MPPELSRDGESPGAGRCTADTCTDDCQQPNTKGAAKRLSRRPNRHKLDFVIVSFPNCVNLACLSLLSLHTIPPPSVAGHFSPAVCAAAQYQAQVVWWQGSTLDTHFVCLSVTTPSVSSSLDSLAASCSSVTMMVMAGYAFPAVFYCMTRK